MLNRYLKLFAGANFLKTMSESPYFLVKPLKARPTRRSANKLCSMPIRPKSITASATSVDASVKTNPAKSKAKGNPVANIQAETSQSRKRHVEIKYEDQTERKEEVACTNVKNERWEPPNWIEQYDNILEMRKQHNAPVDTMGCDRISDEKAEPRVI